MRRVLALAFLVCAAPALAQTYRKVADLPRFPRYPVVFLVDDGASASDCSTGGGSATVWCAYDVTAGAYYAMCHGGNTVCGAGATTDAVEVEDGDNAGTFTSIDSTARFDDSGDINFTHGDGGAGGPDTVIGTVRANSVALGTDTTGGYAGSASEGGPATSALAVWDQDGDTGIQPDEGLTDADDIRFDLAGTERVHFDSDGNGGLPWWLTTNVQWRSAGDWNESGGPAGALWVAFDTSTSAPLGQVFWQDGDSDTTDFLPVLQGRSNGNALGMAFVGVIASAEDAAGGYGLSFQARESDGTGLDAAGLVSFADASSYAVRAAVDHDGTIGSDGCVRLASADDDASGVRICATSDRPYVDYDSDGARDSGELLAATPVSSSAPFTCDSTWYGQTWYDSGNGLCVCNASGWVRTVDESTGCS